MAPATGFVGVREGVLVDPELLVDVLLLVREGVTVIVGPGVRLGVWVRSMMPNPWVAVLVPGFRMMIGSVPLEAGVCPPEEEDVFVALLEEEPDPAEEPSAVTNAPNPPDPKPPEPSEEPSSVPSPPSRVSAVEIPGSVPIN